MDTSTELWRWAEIDLDSLIHNVRVIRQHLQAGTQFMAVVKRNAYGHGMVPVARAAVAAGADYLGVHSLEEGIELREANLNHPILVMGYFPPKEAYEAISKHLISTVVEPELAIALDKAAHDIDTIAQVHVKVDTGIHRYGATVEEATKLLHFLSYLRHLRVTGLYTHFSSADEPQKRLTEVQLEKFLRFAAAFPQVNFLHAANSAATLRFPKTHLNLVRTGLAMYGLYPFRKIETDVQLRPVLSVKARVIRLHQLKPGDGVSYGLSWVSEKDALVALVYLGYGDGLSRLLSNRGEFIIHGQRVPIRGNICMDQCIVEVTTVPRVKVSDEVVFIGRQGTEEITVDEVAGWMGTISYEVVSGISARLPRIYSRNRPNT